MIQTNFLNSSFFLYFLRNSYLKLKAYLYYSYYFRKLWEILVISYYIYVYFNTYIHIYSVLVALISSAAVGVVEEATQVVGAAVGRTVEVGVWAFPLPFLLPLLQVSFQVKYEWCFIFTYPLWIWIWLWFNYSGFSL